METRAKHLIVGLFVILTLIGGVAFSLWIAKSDFEYNLKYYHIFFPGSVNGLNIGGKVSYKGVPIGSIKKIELNPENLEYVKVLIGINQEIPITEGAIASLESQGLTGYAYIQILGGTKHKPAIKTNPGEPYPIIPARFSPIEEMMTSLPKAIHKMSLILDRFNELMDDDNRKTFTQILKKSELALTSFTVTATEIGKTTQQINTLLANNKDAFDDIAKMGSYEMIRTLSQIQATMNSLSRLAERFENNPQGLLFEDTQQGRHVKLQ